MKIEYRKLASQDDFSQCIDLQRSIFGLSDIDIVSPLILQLIARENPSMGILLGAFKITEEKQELIGFIISMATSLERSLYGTVIGVKTQYLNKGYGLYLILKLREEALKNNLEYLFGVYEPLDKNLAHLYINHLGFIGTHYQEDIYYLNGTNKKDHVPTDKILFKWDFKSLSKDDKIKNNSREWLQLYPIATSDNMPDSPHVLVEIPYNFDLMKKEDIKKAMYWRQRTKEIFTHYINHRNYIIYDYLTSRENQIKKSFYLLKAQ